MTQGAGRVVLVTGATGFIGRRLVDALGRRGVAIRVLTRDTAKARALWSGDMIAVVSADLTAPQTIGDACRGVQTLFHLAGYAHAEDEGSVEAAATHHRVTVMGTEALLAAAARAGVRRFVFVSSVKAMGEETRGCADESRESQPTTAYGKAKREAERSVLETGGQKGIHSCVLRLPLVYGPGVKGNLRRMIEAIDRGRFPPLPETSNKKSMVHVDDVVQAALLAAESPLADGQTYIVTDGRAYSSRQIYSLICQGLGKPIPGWSIPLSVLRSAAALGDWVGHVRGRRFFFDSDTLQKLLGSAWYSCEKIGRELGYEPRHTFVDSVGEMLEAYRRIKVSGPGWER